VKSSFLGVLLFALLSPIALADTVTPIADMLIRGTTGLGLCLAVFSVGVFCMKRMSLHVQGTKKEIIVKERVAISSKTQASLVEIRGEVFLMISGSENVSMTKMLTPNPITNIEELSIVASEKLLRVGGL